MERGRGIGVVQPYVAGFLYVIGFSVLSVAAMVKTKFNNRLRVALLTVTVLAFFFLDGGHLITLVPKLMGSEGVRAAAGEVGEHHVETYSAPLAAVGLVVTLGLTFVMGRAVCAYGCPVGAVQELVYDVPTGSKGRGKLILPTKKAYFIRLAGLIMIVGLYLGFGLDLIQVIAPYQLWTMGVTFPGLLIMATFFVASLFVYRPFCRLFCPYGAIASLVARFSRFKIEKGNSCTGCGLCEQKCPTEEIDEKYGECYLCGRCFHACSTNAIQFFPD